MRLRFDGFIVAALFYFLTVLEGQIID